MEDSPSARVLMTADTVGGVWTYALELSRALAEKGVEVALATMGAPLDSDQWRAVQSIPGLQVFESDFKLEWMADPWQDIARAGDWLLELEDQLHPDYIHLNSYVHGALPWRAPTLVVGHSCVLSWWQAVRGGPAPPEWDRYTREVTRGLRSADLVAAPTEFLLTALEKHYGPCPVRLLLPNSRDPALFPSGIKEDFILTAGRLWDEAKNLQALDQVAPYLPWPVYAAGPEIGPDGAAPTFLYVRKLGRQPPDSLASWMGRAAIYALPARYEPFGLSALEAALAGCALVLGDIPSLREVWGDAAFFVHPDDHKALRSALELLIEDECLRLSLATQARSRALLFSPEKVAHKYLTAYGLAGCLRTSRSGRSAWEAQRVG
jgi:glycogen synthase